jgi:coatomer subunit beta
MTVIRYCITQEDHELKKLLMLYWEVVPKYGADGKLITEMILVCNALRNDLNSPNEYIRGCMLRFLCRLREAEILEPLIPSVKQSLEHRHSFVRRNAALAAYNIHKAFGDKLLPDGPELMGRFITEEGDMSARRNAFLMLFNEAEGIAIDFLTDRMDDISRFGDSFALLVLELSRKTCRRDPAQKSRFVRCLFQMLQSGSAAVSYEAAWTLVSLSTAPTAVRAAAQTYATLLNKTTDNNVKLIVLDRLTDLKRHHVKIVREMLMDVLRALNSPNIDICKKVLSLVIDMVGPRNIEEVMQVMKREVVRSQESEMEKGNEYKALLIQGIHKCALKFTEVADSVVLVLLDFLSGDAGYDVMLCVKSIVEQYPSFRPTILSKLNLNMDEITSPDAMRVAVWIMGEYCETKAEDGSCMLLTCFDRLQTLLGEPPFVEVKDKPTGENKPETVTTTKNIVLADGTYASVTSTETVNAGPTTESHSLVRKAISGGDILLGTVVGVSLTKMGIKALQGEVGAKDAGGVANYAVLVLAGVGKLAEVTRGDRVGVHADCLSRLAQCVRVLLDENVRAKLATAYTETCRAAFSEMVTVQRAVKTRAADLEAAVSVSQADDLIHFRQLRSSNVQGGIEVDLMDADDISRATGSEASSTLVDNSKLQYVHQLTGFSDPVYCEASMTVHDYDIILDLLIINRTPNTLTNLTVELGTMGDLRLVERPQSYTIGPLDEHRTRANIKVSSTETGHIFGTIVFDNASSAEKSFVNLADIQLNIMDYIRPGDCSGEDFRSMWAEFEWENKVAISTQITDLFAFLSHIVKSANMKCLTPVPEDAHTNFLAANLYARSVFGEDALVNMSIEKRDGEGGDGKLSGYIRIRSKTQGIALSLGDRITTVQRSLPPSDLPSQ